MRRRVDARDPNGDLQAQHQGQWANFTTRWEAMSGFVHLTSINMFDNISVIFVQVEDFDHGAGR